MLFDLHAAAEDLNEIGDDLAFEDAGIVGLETVQNFAAHRHDALIFRVARELDTAERGIALDDIDLAFVGVARAAVHKLLHAVGKVEIFRKILLDAHARLFRLLAAALVDEHLIGDPVGLRLVLYKINLQLFLEEIRHRLADEAVGDGFFRLVFVGRARGEAVRHKDQAVGNVRECDLALIFLILVRFFDVSVDRVDERGLGRGVRRAAVLEPRGVVVILDGVRPVGEAERRRHAYLVFGLILAVLALSLGLDEIGLRERPLPRKFRDIVRDAVFVAELRRFKLRAVLRAEAERHPGVHDGLSAKNIKEVALGDVDIGKDFNIRLPAGRCAGLFPIRRLNEHFALDLAFGKMERILVPVAPDSNIHILGGVLRGARAETVQTERVFVVAAVVIFILAAGVQLTVDKLPVEALFRGVPVHGTAAAEILYLNGLVIVESYRYNIAEALARLVDGVGENFKYGVLTALQSVGAEDNARTLAHPVGALELGDAFVAVFLRFCCCHLVSPYIVVLISVKKRYIV